jgi:4-hydroxy-tetrahydrodipicolinate synthase
MSLRDTLKGTGVALITPFNKSKEIDFEALGKVIDFVLRGGVEYLVILGTTAEVSTLNRAEKIDILNYTFNKVSHGTPVVVGIGGNDTREVLEDVESFPLQKAAAILSVSPYYSKPSQQGIFEHYKAISEAAPKPVILYNVPTRTGSNITAETTLRLAAECDNIQGIKEASGNISQCLYILQNKPQEFLVTSGDDLLTLPLIAAGMDGVISVAANCFPKDFSEMVRQSLANDFVGGRSLMYKLLKGFDLLFEENNPAGVKAFLSEMNLIENSLRLPLAPLSDKVHQKVKDYLKTVE